MLAGWTPVRAEEDAAFSLHARSAVLMDGDSGRILYGKESDTPLAMASTTKIMTCILALELGSGNQICTASANAAAQPQGGSLACGKQSSFICRIFFIR